MPHYKNPFEKGKLIIQFNVTFPTDHWLDDIKLKTLENLLPPRKDVMIPDDVEECELTEYDPQQSRNRQYAHMHDDDDDEDGGNPRVQCASQ